MHGGTELSVSSSDESEDSDHDNNQIEGFTDGETQSLTKEAKVTPNKFSVSRPGLRHICIREGSPFPLFHL